MCVHLGCFEIASFDGALEEVDDLLNKRYWRWCSLRLLDNQDSEPLESFSSDLKTGIFNIMARAVGQYP